jgi:chromatin remodeling complex protein RSC6
MAETLALLKQLNFQKQQIEYKIRDLTEDKLDIDQKIDNIINNYHDGSCHHNGHRSLRSNSSKFTKPLPIHAILANFLEVPIGTLMPRTEVTRRINRYIKENDLQDKENSRKINPDEKLKELFKMDDTMQLTFFNIQKYISPLFKLDC